MNSIPLDYYFIGHVCHDKAEKGYTFGGTASFGASWVSTLGFNPIIFTAFGHDFLFEHQLADYLVLNTGSDKTSCFLNSYDGNNRSQLLLKKASNIKVEDISIQNKSCVVHLAPICDEFSVELIDSFHHNVFVAVTPQGWLRDVDSEHRISSKTMNWDYLEKADAVIISDEECPQDQLEFEKMKKAIRLLIVTKNESGTVAYVDGKHLYLPAFPVKPVNFSGAGDVFASVFFARYFHTKDLKNSLILANCAASLHVENIILAKEEQMRLLNQRVSRYNEIFAV